MNFVDLEEMYSCWNLAFPKINLSFQWKYYLSHLNKIHDFLVGGQIYNWVNIQFPSANQIVSLKLKVGLHFFVLKNYSLLHNFGPFQISMLWKFDRKLHNLKKTDWAKWQ